MGFIFQFPSLIPSLTALENVMLPTIFSNHIGENNLRERSQELLNTRASYPADSSSG